MSLFTPAQLAAWRRLGVHDGDVTPEQLRRIQDEYRHLGPRIVELWAGVRARGDTEAHLSINGLYERDCPVCGTVNRITQGPDYLADTLSNTAAIPQPTGDAKMFTSSNFEMNVTKIIAAALVAAFVLTFVG